VTTPLRMQHACSALVRELDLLVRARVSAVLAAARQRDLDEVVDRRYFWERMKRRSCECRHRPVAVHLARASESNKTVKTHCENLALHFSAIYIESHIIRTSDIFIFYIVNQNFCVSPKSSPIFAFASIVILDGYHPIFTSTIPAHTSTGVRSMVTVN